MSDLGFNKIAGCVLATGLALIGLNEASKAFFHDAHHEKDGYHIDVPEASTGPVEAVVEGPRDYFKLISEGSVEAGKAVANKCQQCHKFEAGQESTGPTLYNIIGRKIASEPGFKYTSGANSMSAFGETHSTWGYEQFDHYIEAPKKTVPGTAMNFIGVKKQKDRADLMAYLRTLTSGEPLALPPPLPPEATAPPPAEGAPAPADGAAPAAPGGATPAPGTPAPAGASPATPPTQPAPTQGAPAKPAPAQPAKPAPH